MGVSGYNWKCIYRNTNKHIQKPKSRRHRKTYISNIYTARTSLLLLGFFFSLSLDFGGDRRAGRWEMRCLNTPLLSSLHPTPPHTWDGHFISECSKWKGDLNLPCFPLTPSLSPSPTHRASYCWWTAHCWLSEPAASRPNLVIKNTGYTVVYYFEQILFFQPGHCSYLRLLVVSWSEIPEKAVSWEQVYSWFGTKHFDMTSLIYWTLLLDHYSVLGLFHCSWATAATSRGMHLPLISYE